METTVSSFMPLLFKLLFGFIGLNVIINLILLYTRRMRIYKLLVLYWTSIFFTFILQSIFQTGNLEVILAYSVFFFSATIFGLIGFETIGRKFPFRKYLILYACSYPLTFILHYAGFGFTTVAMPISVIMALPLVHISYYILYIDRKSTTRLQKVLGFIYATSVVHSINFALFRMEPGSQIWGWITTYAIYDCLAIFLPSIALEKSNLLEQSRLQNVVNERTKELRATSRENENLIKVLLHDMSSPLMVTRFYISNIKPSNQDEQNLLEKAKDSLAVIDNILIQVKNIHALKSHKPKLNPVAIDDCMKEVGFIFSQKLEKKNIKLIFKNQLSPGTRVMADQTTLTHSVLSNLVSNGVKFSQPNSDIVVTAKEIQGSIILEVADQGSGIPDDVVENVMNDQVTESLPGTEGEEGSGMGLTIVKSFVDSYGGQLQFLEAQDYGTNVRITLNRA